MATTGTGIASFLAGFPNVRKQAAQAGFGKAPSITDVEKEAAALRGFLGTTDYASRLKESQDLAKLQIALAMAQRGFAGMSAQPQRGESSIGTLGRTLFSPLAGDIAPIAGRLMQQRQAAKAAEEKEDRDVKLAAYTQAATRGKDLDATTLGILKAAAAKPSGITTSAIQNVNAEVQIDGETKKLSGVPIILRKDNEGRSRFYLAGAHQANDGTKVKADTELSSFKKVPTKDQLPKLYENIGKTTLNIPLQAKAGRSPSINLGPTKRASLHPNEFSQLPEAVRRDLVEYKAPPQAGGSLTTWINVSGTPQSINLPDFSTILEDGKEITLTAFQYSQLPEVMKVGSVLSRKEKPTIERGVTGQVFENGEFVDLNNVTRVTKFINDAPVDTYYRQLAEGRLDKIPQDTFTETIATHGAFNKEDSIHIALLRDTAGNETGVVADALDDASAVAGGVVDVWRSRIEAPNKGTDRVRYYFKGTDVTGKIQHLVDTDAFQSGPLHSRDVQKAGHVADTRVPYTAATLTITGDNFARLKKVLGPDVSPAEIVTVLKKPAQGDLPEEIEVRFRGNTVPLTRKDLDSNMFQERPLSQRQQETANFFSDVWQAGENLYVKPDTLDALNKKYPDLKATAGETVQVRRLKSDLKKSKLWLKDIFLSQADAREFLQATPLTADQKERAGHTVVTRQPFVNISKPRRPLTFTLEGEKEARTVPVDGRIRLSENEWGRLPREIQASLGEVGDVSTEPVRYTFREARTLGGQPGQPGDQWLPGMEISLTPQAYNALPESVKGDLTTDTGETAVIRKRRHIGSLVKLIKEQEPDLATAQFGRDETDAVLALYPGSARGASAAKSLYETIVSIMRQSSTFQGRASNAAISSANKKATTYGASIKEELKGAKKIYEGFQRKGALPRTAFDQLPFSDQMAFARIPRRNLNLKNVNAKWELARTSLKTTKAKYKTPTNEDVAMFANKVRLRTILQDMLENYDLSNTGVLIGPIQKLRGALSDWPLVGSDEAGKFASTLSQLGANLRALQAEEGKDARPSNYRISLISELLPKWGKAEDINTRNVKQAVAVLDTNIKSYFSDAVSSGTVVPQIFSRMAAEAGLKDLGVDQGKYWWLDPEVGATEKLPFTMEAYRRSIGEVPWTLRSFEEMKPGTRLPPIESPLKGGKQTYWIKLEQKDKDGRGMIIQTDKGGRVKKGAEPLTFVFGED
jgi:hypothetical protein